MGWNETEPVTRTLSQRDAPPAAKNALVHHSRLLVHYTPTARLLTLPLGLTWG
jgi:hypothetical protein